MIVSGRIVDLVLLALFAIAALYLSKIADRWTPRIRKIAGVSAIAEGIGRATEMGRPVHFTSGYGGSLYDTEVGPQIVSGLSVFGYVSELCAKSRVKLIVSVGQPETIPLLEEYVRSAYVAAGSPPPNMEETLRFLSRDQFAFVSAVTGIMRRELPAANIVVGPLWAEVAQLIASGTQVGALTVVGTARTAQMPWIAIFSDYMLIGEEIFAAGAQLGNDRQALNTLVSQDLGKILAIVIMILGSFLALMGTTWLQMILEV